MEMTPKDPEISVVLCTRNRAPLLKKALESLVAQDFPQDAFEIVLVDNASDDETPEVARAIAARAPLRYLREARIGLCVARNTGWRAARAPIVAYFDDDAEAVPGWLAAIREVFAGADAETIGVVGGPAIPVWEAPRPDWLDDAIAGALTIVDLGPERKDIPDLAREWLVGANMAMPKQAIEACGGFHPGLDRVGANLLSSGDVHLQKQIAQSGLRVVYAPGMAIRHLAAASRLRKDWFRRRFYWQGISDAVMHLIDHDPSPAGRARAAAGRLRALLRNRRRLRALLRRAETAEQFKLHCFALIDLGFVMGLLGAARR